MGSFNLLVPQLNRIYALQILLGCLNMLTDRHALNPKVCLVVYDFENGLVIEISLLFKGTGRILCNTSWSIIFCQFMNPGTAGLYHHYKN